MKSTIVCVFMYGAIAAFSNGADAVAATLYVDNSSAATTPDGSLSAPFKSIQTALDVTADGDTVRVAPGLYSENVTIGKNNVKLLGANPVNTTIQNSGSVVTINALNDNIAGFTITGGGFSGILVQWAPASAIINNNIIMDNGYGIFVRGTALVVNNVIVSNSTGVGASDTTSLFNNVIDSAGSNLSGGCGPLVANNALIPANKVSVPYTNCTMALINNINPAAALFALDNSYTLQAASPCINAGRPLISDNDPDGSRNDMGAYGGPGAADFWPGTAGGPIITELLVSPPSVPQGGKITIKATAQSISHP